MDKKIYFGYYKCRLCGKEFYKFSCPNKEMAIDTISENKNRINAIHFHEDDSIGYADFIGFRLEEMR